MPDTLLSSSSIISTNFLAMIPTYCGVLSAIEKALQEVIEEYQGVRKSLYDLVEG